jgi:hypothetical protein
MPRKNDLSVARRGDAVRIGAEAIGLRQAMQRHLPLNRALGALFEALLYLADADGVPAGIIVVLLDREAGEEMRLA